MKALHWLLCRIGIHERRVTGHTWHCIWCRPVTATPTGEEKAGVRVEFWPDAIDMVNRIELIFWTDYDRYEQDCLFLSRGEASDLIGQLNRAIKDLDAFLLAPPMAGKGETG